jgi:hypothetical protein
MRLSKHIRSFIKYALVTLLGFEGVLGCLHLRIIPGIGLWPHIAVGLILLIGVFGMVWSLMRWFVSGVAAWHRARHHDLKS